jgi:hypothetical protein
VYSLEYADILEVYLTPHHVDHCYTNVIPVHCCSAGNSFANVIRGYCCSIMCSNTDFSSHCYATCSNGGNQRFTLLCNNDSRSWGLPTPQGKSQQTYIHGRTHKVLFAHARAWRIPNKQKGVWRRKIAGKLRSGRNEKAENWEVLGKREEGLRDKNRNNRRRGWRRR